MSDYKLVMSDELQHHGILGMKWGVRRYQNYDGTYTQAGMKRYNNSMQEYEKKKNSLKEAKKSGASKGELDNKKIGVKQAKRKLVKDYKHLKQDKLADKGKKRYANGETITGNDAFTFGVAKAAGIVTAGSQYLAKQGYLKQETANLISAGSMVATGTAYAKKYLIDERHNKQLRAYYSHTSNY